MYVCVSSEGASLFWWENYQSCREARLFFCVWCSKQASQMEVGSKGDFTVTSEHRKMWPFLHAWSASPSSSSLIQAISYTVKENRHFRGVVYSWMCSHAWLHVCMRKLRRASLFWKENYQICREAWLLFFAYDVANKQARWKLGAKEISLWLWYYGNSLG